MDFAEVEVRFGIFIALPISLATSSIMIAATSVISIPSRFFPVIFSVFSFDVVPINAINTDLSFRYALSSSVQESRNSLIELFHLSICNKLVPFLNTLASGAFVFYDSSFGSGTYGIKPFSLQ